LSRAFAEIVEDMKRLSPDEKEELQEELRKYLNEERRRKIRVNAEAGLKEYRNRKLQFFSNADEMMRSLSDK
jgi:hypothetical protein